jgi:hypothetical protein
MRTSRRRWSIGSIACLTLSLLLESAPLQAASIKEGDLCTPVGATFKQGAITFVCTKIASEGVWKSKTKATTKSAPPETFIMPNLVGMNLQLAQDLLQSKGSYLVDQEDFKGLGRFQLIDSNWKVCSQSPTSGKKILTSSLVTLSSVKLSERC